MTEILTVDEVAKFLKCKPSLIYNMTRKRGQLRYDLPLPVLKAPLADLDSAALTLKIG